ncbi:hypothetical protein ACP4OV_010714 [Aristida adscensionis]
MEEASQEAAPGGADGGGTPALPHEAITEILARLPAKSVGRFRAASRAWCAALSSDFFVALHARLLLTPEGSSYDGHLYSWRPGGAVERLAPRRFPEGAAVPLARPCRGLVLIRSADSCGYFVFNPSTGMVLPLPDTKMPLKMIRRPPRLSLPAPPFYLNVSYGLAYCEITKKLKVVRLFCYPEFENGMVTSSSCEVLVLDTLAYWRPTAEQPPLCWVQQEKPAVFLNGYLHFLCRDGSITTFNISDETFGSLPPPSGFENVAPVLTELDGCLCLCYGEPHGDDLYNVCVLRDYKEAWWEMFCCIDRTAWPDSERTLLKSFWIAPLGVYCLGGRQKIMFGTGSCMVFAVERDGSAPEILLTPDETIIGSFEDDNIPALGLFEESLQPVGRTIEEMAFSSPTAKAWCDVLKWLPARSVLELSLVCREWRAIIMTDHFIQSHIIHANSSKSPWIKFIMDPQLGFYLDLEDWTDQLRPHLISDIVCSQPCHGLNVGSCVSWDFICNPALGYSKQIIFHDNDGTFFAGRIGLGYDSEINKHVLVHITYKEKNLDTRHYELQCGVRYVSDQQWRPVVPPARPVAATPPTFANGKIYWMVEPNLGPVSAICEIVAFDVKTNEFEVLQGPPCSHECGRMTILQLQDALCVACSERSENTMDIWMMKDFGIWLMEYHIELKDFLPDYSSENTNPLAIDPKNGQILLSTGWSLGYYDPKTAAIKNIYHEDIPEHDIKFCPILCHESLVCPLDTF